MTGKGMKCKGTSYLCFLLSHNDSSSSGLLWSGLHLKVVWCGKGRASCTGLSLNLWIHWQAHHQYNCGSDEQRKNRVKQEETVISSSYVCRGLLFSEGWSKWWCMWGTLDQYSTYNFLDLFFLLKGIINLGILCRACSTTLSALGGKGISLLILWAR